MLDLVGLFLGALGFQDLVCGWDLANLLRLQGGLASLSCSQDQLMRPAYFPGSVCRLLG